MTKKLTLSLATSLLIHFSLAAQLLLPCLPSIAGAPSCALACVHCNFGTIQGATADNLSQGPFPAFCGTLNKPEWYAFVAGATSGAFLLNASACDQGLGLQIALYDDCGSAPLACLSGGGLSLTLPVSNLTIGETYFLLVDGFQGDDCAYTLQPADPDLATAPALGNSPATLSGMGVACPGATISYCLPQPVANASHYTWQAPQGSLINGQAGPLTLPAASGACVEVTFGQIGGQVRAIPKNSCSTGTAVTRNTAVQNPLITHAGILYLSEEYLPYEWQQGAQTLTQKDTTYNLQAVLTSYLGCDSIVFQTVIVYKPNTAYGMVYWDVDNNGVYNASTDIPYSSGAILESASGQFSSSGPDGKYKFTGLNDLDTVQVAPIPGLTANPAFQPFNKNQTPWAQRNFGLYPLPPGYDLSVFAIGADAFRPGFNRTFTVGSKNKGLTPANGVQIRLVLPDILTYLNASLAPDVINGDTLTWNIGSLAPGAETLIHVTVKCDLVPIGTPFHIFASSTGILPSDDLYPANNIFSRNGTVVGSYDPNDKLAYPEYLTPDQLSGGQPVEYTIRFQNTGNYPAEFVRIIDTLGAGLDPASFRFLASSHPCSWKLSGSGVVEFFFKDINLPDSVSNEPESHGFVSFNIRLKPSLGLGDVAENFADIYFDFNQPVRTNTAGVQIVYFLPNNPPGGTTMSARPNPASYVIHFAWTKPLQQAGILRLFTLNGVLAREIPVDAGRPGTDMYVADLASGNYIALLDAGQQRYVKMVLIQRAATSVPIRRPGGGH